MLYSFRGSLLFETGLTRFGFKLRQIQFQFSARPVTSMWGDFIGLVGSRELCHDSEVKD